MSRERTIIQGKPIGNAMTFIEEKRKNQLQPQAGNTNSKGFRIVSLLRYEGRRQTPAKTQTRAYGGKL